MAYLRLFHGRLPSPDGGISGLDDWGLDGPVLGPFPYIHVTHAAEIEFGDSRELRLIDGFVYYANVLYADWSVVDDVTFQGSPTLWALRAPFLLELTVIPPMSIDASRRLPGHAGSTKRG